jgi:hypothetical protein
MSRPVSFGKGRPRKPRPTVETTPRIFIGDIARALFTPRPREATVRVVVNGKPEVLDVVFEDRNFGGRGQPYFLCRTCARKCQHLYLRDDPRDGRRLACRQCSGGLTYKSQHTRTRGLNRVRRLREKIGALPSPLAPIPQRPAHWRRDYWARTVAELAAAESVIAARLRDTLGQVRRRLKRDRHHSNRAI